ncbi:allantoate amidohydrolase [Microbacterium sp. NPDC077663]|uniref:allantoate amidohydrolase n=1 Tax=Microbacterium sp. NPDC077663 TaxID=3364189 RepID=UPI0037C5D11D
MTSVTSLLGAISGIGRDPRSGGYARPVFSTAERDLRAWFVGEAEARGLDVEVDRNGIIWAWWGTPGPGAVVTGSHLDSVPGGGAFDGPLGIAAALAAVDVLRARGTIPAKPLAIAVFPEEEGSRFGVACLGSRLLSGALSPDAARRLTDREGDTLADVFAASGVDPAGIGPDPETLARIGVFVELHVEQGRGLIDLDRSFAVAESILGHGRFKVSVRGEGNHAGTTLMADRRDPVVAAAAMVGRIAELAGAVDDARATVGRFEPVPGGTNVIASSVDFWIDARHPDDDVTRRLIADIDLMCGSVAAAQGCEAVLVEESWSPTVGFDPALARRLGSVLPDSPFLRTGAGHDAGILASVVPTGMLFVRNPSGISHSPEEHVVDADADASAAALADVLQELLS